MMKTIKKNIFPGANLDREKRKAVVIMLKALKKFECKFPKQYREAKKASAIVWDYMTKLGEKNGDKLIAINNGIQLHQLGLLSLPKKLIEKIKNGDKFTEKEKLIFAGYPQKSLEVLSEYIVDINPLALEIIEKSEEREDGKGRLGLDNQNIPSEVKIFQIVKKYVKLYNEHKDNKKVIKILLNSHGEFNMIYIYSLLGYISQNKQFVEDILNN